MLTAEGALITDKHVESTTVRRKNPGKGRRGQNTATTMPI